MCTVPCCGGLTVILGPLLVVSLTFSIICFSLVSLTLSLIAPRCAIDSIISLTSSAFSGFTRAMRATDKHTDNRWRAGLGGEARDGWVKMSGMMTGVVYSLTSFFCLGCQQRCEHDLPPLLHLPVRCASSRIGLDFECLVSDEVGTWAAEQ